MKRVWTITLLYTVLICLPLGLFFWLWLMILFPTILVGVSLWLMLVLTLMATVLAGRKMFVWLRVRLLLRRYTERFKLTPKKLSGDLQEPLENFSYGNHWRVVYRLGGAKNDRALLAALEQHYGELN